MLDEGLLNLVKLQLDELKIHSRKMFGGIGIFSEKTIFSLIYDEKLYFRSTEKVATRYSSESIQFQHPSRNSKMP